MNADKYFEKIKQYELMASKDIGQNFLVDQKVAEQIVDSLDIHPGEKVLEIGPGAGSLSYFLSLTSGDCDLFDIDSRFIEKLKEDFASLNGIHPKLQNVLSADLSSYGKIIGNLPYYITSSIIERFLLTASKCQKAVFMVQKEAYSRLAATSGEDYGPMNVLISFLYEGKRLLNVPPSSFVPRPHVSSTVFSLSRKGGVSIERASALYALAKALFSRRRKTVLNSLSAYLGNGEKAASALLKSGIDARKRPEELDVDAFARLLSSLQ